jgi:hypothetical protein
MHYIPSSAAGQQLVTATVHLVGAVETETGHVANAGGAHITARLGGLLFYLLDRDAVAGFVWAVAEAREFAARAFGKDTAPGLPGHRQIDEQSVGLVVRLSGAQELGEPSAATASASRDGGPFVALRIGGLRIVVRDRIALQALTLVTDSTERAAIVLWPSSEDELSELNTGQTPRPRLPRVVLG